MITPMAKYSFLVYHQEYEMFLDELQELGVVEIIQREVTLDKETADRLQVMQQIRNRIDSLRRRKVEPQPPLPDVTAVDLMARLEGLETEREQLVIRLNALQKEINLVMPWGSFDRNLLDRLQEAGCRVRFFVCPEKKYDPAWEEFNHIVRINHLQSAVYFIVFETGLEEISIDAEEVKQPSRSLDELKNLQQEAQERIRQIDQEFDDVAASRMEILREYHYWLESVTDYSKAVLFANDEAGEKIKLLQGWVPATKHKDLEGYLNNTGVIYLSAKPESGERVPVLLKNSRFSRLFEPIGKLFSLPDYQEIDMTPFFAPFFMMFFGFCMADAGYGLLILLVASLLKLKKDKKMRPVLALSQYFGASTAFFGIITGNLFGVSLPGLVAFEPVNEYFLNNDKVFMLAVAVGMVQILFGTALRAANQIRQYGFVYGLSSIGWIFMVLGLLDMFLFKLTGIAGQIVMYLGIFLIVLFSNPKAGLLGRIGKGIWDLYGITGIFGDVLSYIRLFALGVSSSILGFVINDIAIQIRDGMPAILGMILFAIFLLIGHSLNIVIAALGAFVHPMRLTFVEFYKNAGFMGGGKQYKPFAKKQTIK
jgi:V/A-type H+-transporting ATPase subunit I